MLKHTILFFFALLLLGSYSFAQSDKTPADISLPARKKNVLKVKERTLLVGLFGDPSIDEKVKAMMKEFWDFNDEIIFLEKELIPNKIDGDEKDYAILSVDIVKITTYSIGGKSNQYMRFSVKLAEKYNKVRPVYFQDVFYTEAGGELKLGQREIIVAINLIQSHFRQKEEGIGMFEAFSVIAGRKLENRTLLLDKNFIDPDLKIEEISTHYPYPFEICDVAVIEKALLERDSSYAFIEPMPMGLSANVMMHYLFDCKDLQVLSTGETYNGAFDKFSNLINEENLKSYVKNYFRLQKMAEKKK